MKVSVITISFNAEACIESTIRSVLSQSYDEFEYVVVDGNSTDRTVDIIKKYVGRISKWISEPDTGIYNAMNKAVRMSEGEYCIFMNAGDVFLNPLVLKQVSPFLEDGVDYLVGNEVSVKKGKIVDYACAPKKITTRLFVQRSLSHQASFIRRELLLRCPYDESLRMVSDWKFCIQTLLLGKATYRAINVDVCQFNQDGITFTHKNFGHMERMKVLQELLPEEVKKVHAHRTLWKRVKERLKREKRIVQFYIRKINK